MAFSPLLRKLTFKPGSLLPEIKHSKDTKRCQSAPEEQSAVRKHSIINVHKAQKGIVPLGNFLTYFDFYLVWLLDHRKEYLSNRIPIRYHMSAFGVETKADRFSVLTLFPRQNDRRQLQKVTAYSQQDHMPPNNLAVYFTRQDVKQRS